MTKQEKTALISSAVNFVLTVTKFTLAAFCHSIALLAEAWHSLSDIISSFLVFLGIRADRLKKKEIEHRKERKSLLGDFKMSPEEETKEEKPARKTFHEAGIEGKMAIGIGIFLIYISYNIFRKIIHPTPISIEQAVPGAAIIALLAFFSYLLYKFEVHIGEESNSPGLIADGYHSKVDMLGSSLVAIALLSDKLGIALDKPAAAVICLVIFIHGVHVLITAIKSYVRGAEEALLSGEAATEDILVHFFKEKAPHLAEKVYTILSRIFHIDITQSRGKRQIAMRGLLTIIVVYLLSGFYILNPSETAIVERFGRPLQRKELLTPGLHYYIPWPIDKLKRVDTKSIRSVTVGYELKKEEDVILWTNVHYTEELSFLTGENSFIDMHMKVHYEIDNLYDYLYNTREPDKILTELTYSSVREIISISPFFPIITVERENFEEIIKKSVQKKANQQFLGIRVVSVAVRDMHPPTELAPSFQDVVSAEEDYETYINKAVGYKNEVIPISHGKSHKILNEAQAYSDEKTSSSEGDAERFTLRLQPYLEHPDITRTRLYLEAMEESLPPAKKFILHPRGKEKPQIWFYGKEFPALLDSKTKETEDEE